MYGIKLDVFGSLDLDKRVAMLALPPKKRRQVLGGIGRELKRAAARNLKGQHDVDGKPWAPRKRGSKRRLLRRINRQLMANLVTPNFVEVGFRGAVALKQHEGDEQVMTPAKMARELKDDGQDDEPASRKQAKELRSLDYKVRVKGSKKWRKPSLSWITDNIKQKQAGLLIRMLRDEPTKKRWITRIPGRGFLGATEDDISKFVNRVYDNTINSRV